MQIEQPNIYKMYGRSYLNVDELIDYNLDRYNFVKDASVNAKNQADVFIKSINNSTIISPETFICGVNACHIHQELSKFIQTLRKQFAILVEYKKNGIEYIPILNNKKPAQ